MKTSNWELIGNVGVDSGQLMITDPCYLRDWKDVPYQDIRKIEDTQTKKVYQYGVDFKNYEEVLVDGKTINQCIAEGRFKDIQVEFEPTYDYNGVSHSSFPHGTGQIPHALGFEGRAVSFSSGWGDGLYPVYGLVNSEGRVIEVRIVMDSDADFTGMK